MVFGKYYSSKKMGILYTVFVGEFGVTSKN